MSPSSLNCPGPDRSHSSLSQPHDSQSSPDPLSIQHDLAPPREGHQQPKPVARRSQIVETNGNDLDYNRLRSQHSLFIDPFPDEPQLQLPMAHKPQLCVEGSVSGTKKEIPHAPLSLETTCESGDQTEFQALISRPDGIQSIENIHAEGFNFSANLRQVTDSNAKERQRDRKTRKNVSPSQPMRSSQGKADSGVVNHHPLQDGNKYEISTHQDLAQRGEKRLTNPAGTHEGSYLSIPNQSKYGFDKGDQAGFPGLHLLDPAHPSMDNRLVNKREGRRAAPARSPSHTNPHIDNIEVGKKRTRLEIAQSSKVSARSTCQIENQGSNPKLEDPREVPVKTNQHCRHHTLGSLPKSLVPGSLGKDQVIPEVSLSQADPYHCPPTNPSIPVATKHDKFIEQEASNQTAGISSPRNQCLHPMGEQRISKSAYQTPTPFHGKAVPEMDLEQAPANGWHSHSKSQKRISDAIPDLTFTHIANNVTIPPQRSPTGSTKSLIDEKGHGTGRDPAPRQPEKGHSPKNRRTTQHANYGSPSSISAQSQPGTAIVPGRLNSIPQNILEKARDHDPHLHSSPPNISKRRDRPSKILRHRKDNTTTMSPGPKTGLNTIVQEWNSFYTNFMGYEKHASRAGSTTPVTPGLKTGLNTIAEEWNSFFINFVRYEKHMASKLSGFKQHITYQARIIAGLHRHLTGKEQEIMSLKERNEAKKAQLRDLMAEKEAVEARAQEVERQLADSSKKAEVLRGKCQQMKTRFNEGLAEQQKFYVKNKEQCDKVLSAAQQERQAREHAIEVTSKACEETRLGFQKLLEEAKREAFRRSALRKSESKPL